jgi:hypothetical protein
LEDLKMAVQCIELRDDLENPIHCPFCGIKISAGASEENANGWIVGNCDHLLFTWIDEVGFEYRSARFDAAVEAVMSGKTEEDREELEDNFYELLELVKLPNALMFQSIMGPPAQETSSIAFAPAEAG